MSPRNAKQQTLRQRRRRNLLVAASVVLLIGVWVYLQEQNLRNTSFSTGYLLMGCLLFLAAFNLRKMMPFLTQLGSAKAWMQLHIYVGFSTFAFFAFHIGFSIPSGMFESVLAGLYLTVAMSGVYGLYATRVFPKRLAALPEEVIFENIPSLRQQIAQQTKSLVLTACKSSDVLARFYANRLMEFFEQPRSLAYLVNPSGRLRRQLMAEIHEMNRFLGENEREVGGQLSDFVRQKDDLDYHYAIQGRLKIWMFVHVGLTYSLLIAAIVHGLLAHGFHGGLS